jgi:hypothetical protein
MTPILSGAICPNGLCCAFVVPVLHRARHDPVTDSWEMECPLCHRVFRTPDSELFPREPSAEWIDPAKPEIRAGRVLRWAAMFPERHSDSRATAA